MTILNLLIIMYSYLIHLSTIIINYLIKFIIFDTIGLRRVEVMIINKVSEVMGRKRLKISDVIEGTGLARNTVAELYHGRAKRVDLETLDKLCTYLNVGTGELIEHKKDAED